MTSMIAIHICKYQHVMTQNSKVGRIIVESTMKHKVRKFIGFLMFFNFSLIKFIIQILDCKGKVNTETFQQFRTR